MSPIRTGPPILKEGYPFIAPPALGGVICIVLGLEELGGFLLLVALLVAGFFRNPSRRPPMFEGAALSPADGKVIEVSPVEEVEGRGGPWLKVSIFMSVWNVHVNRSPVDANIVEIMPVEGNLAPAFKEQSSHGNRRNMIRLKMEGGRDILCVQVAGAIARRIVCWKSPGQFVHMGEPIGMIRFGSRVDCYFPRDFDPDVRVGQRVWGGETILGYFQ
jgi:phosphatidylserine decarboxylase